MGLLDRLRGGGRAPTLSVHAGTPNVPVRLLGGQDDLEVVGELAYQAALWQLCGRSLGDLPSNPWASDDQRGEYQHHRTIGEDSTSASAAGRVPRCGT
jgi:hypothetical protein